MCAGFDKPVKAAVGFDLLRLEAVSVFRLLEQDGQVLAELASPEQRKHLHLEGTRTPEKVAMWDDDPDHLAWKQRKRREFQEAYRDATPEAFAEMVNEVRG